MKNILRNWVACAAMLVAAGQAARAYSLKDLIFKSYMHGVYPEAVKPEWIGNPDAYDEVRDILAAKPRDTTTYRNGLEALVIIAAGDPKLAAKTWKLLPEFITGSTRFGSKASLCKYPNAALPCEINYAGFRAKMDLPDIFSLFARQDPGLAPEIIKFLEQGTDLSYQQRADWKWDTKEYERPADRPINFVFLNLRALGNTCDSSPEGSASRDLSAKAIREVFARIQMKKDDPSLAEIIPGLFKEIGEINQDACRPEGIPKNPSPWPPGHEPVQ